MVSRRGLVFVWMVVACTILLGVTGCGLFGGLTHVPGTYEGELACRAVVTPAEGEQGQLDYTIATTLVVDANGALTVNQEPIEVGLEVTRALPDATLAFEVTAIARGLRQVTVTYEPRPTLPGITVTGELVENYQQRANVIRAHGLANLVITDVSGENTFEIDCSGALAGP